MKKRNPSEEIAQVYNLIYPLTTKFLSNRRIKILDAGCGTGELMLAIGKRNMDIEGIDLSVKSIEIARKRAKNSKVK